MGCFSFQSSKNLTCGEGGIILTNDDELAARCWSIHNCGRVPGGVVRTPRHRRQLPAGRVPGRRAQRPVGAIRGAGRNARTQRPVSGRATRPASPASIPQAARPTARGTPTTSSPSASIRTCWASRARRSSRPWRPRAFPRWPAIRSRSIASRCSRIGRSGRTPAAPPGPISTTPRPLPPVRNPLDPAGRLARASPAAGRPQGHGRHRPGGSEGLRVPGTGRRVGSKRREDARARAEDRSRDREGAVLRTSPSYRSLTVAARLGTCRHGATICCPTLARRSGRPRSGGLSDCR